MYQNAEKVLPPALLRQVQQYVEGTEIYIPKGPGKRLGWGESNGTKKHIASRNRDIVEQYHQGQSIHWLMEQYHLSYDSIRKIVGSHRK